jgi:hypothetical protein
MNYMFNVADSLSDANKCAIHTSFDPQTSAWATAGYDDWGDLC